jgi:hypothetical protein
MTEQAESNLPDAMECSDAPFDPRSATLLTTEQLAERIHYDARTIRDRLKDTVFREGVHYFRPFGGRKLLFVWEAIARDMNRVSGAAPFEAHPDASAPTLRSSVSFFCESGELVIEFEYRGMRYREPTLLADTEVNRSRVRGLVQCLDREITRGTFHYEAHFPMGAAHAASLGRRTALPSSKADQPAVPPGGHRAWSQEHLAKLVACIEDEAALAAFAAEVGVSVGEALGRYRRLLADVRTPPREGTRIMTPSWVDSEHDWLRQNFETASDQELTARFPYRRILSVKVRAATLGLKRPGAGESEQEQGSGAQEVAPATPASAENAEAAHRHPFAPYRGWTQEQIAHVVWLRAVAAPASHLAQAIERFGRTEKELRHLFLHLGLSYRYVPFFAEADWKRLEEAFRQGGLDAVYKAFPRRAIGELRARLVSLGLIPGRSIGWRQSEISYLQHSMRIDRSVTEVSFNLGISNEEIHAASERLMRGELVAHEHKKVRSSNAAQ